MNKPHQVLLLWDEGEGADLYALTVTPDEFKELKSINSLFYGLDLPEELCRVWIRVNVSLSNDIVCVPDYAKDCVGKWIGFKLNPGAVVALNDDWAVVSSGMAP